MTFDIHDCASRIRLFKGLGSQKEYKNAKRISAILRKRLENSPVFFNLDKKVREEILAGSRIFVNGIRSAAKQVGWDLKEWDAIYNYLSAQSHHNPVSFYRYEMHGVTHLTVTEYQSGFLNFCLQQAKLCTH
jgi:hypothetical protein